MHAWTNQDTQSIEKKVAEYDYANEIDSCRLPVAFQSITTLIIFLCMIIINVFVSCDH